MTLEQVVKAHTLNTNTVSKPNYYTSYVQLADDDFADTFDGTSYTSLASAEPKGKASPPAAALAPGAKKAVAKKTSEPTLANSTEAANATANATEAANASVNATAALDNETNATTAENATLNATEAILNLTNGTVVANATSDPAVAVIAINGTDKISVDVKNATEVAIVT
jgi:hypothetical protein